MDSARRSDDAELFDALGATHGSDGAPVVVEVEPELGRGTAIGRYVILDRIGSGAMGVVYSAFDPALDRKIALKVLHPGRLDRADAHQRLGREARAMARLDHPNVVTVHDVGMFGDRVFVAMEFIAGGTLREWLQAERPWRVILEVFVQAGEGLAAAHDAGLVHRDFKPDNVMVSTAGGLPRARVMDFGLAHASEAPGDIASTGEMMAAVLAGDDVRGQLTRTGTILGTPAYMAPEQLSGAGTSLASDQFAFCVALHEALFGVPPFKGDTLASLAAAVAVGDRRPMPPTRVAKSVIAAIDRGLAISRDARWPSMRALLDHLRRGTTRRPWVPLALGGALVATIGLGAVAMQGGAEVCPRSTAALDDVWDPPRRERLEAAITGTAVPFAADTWARFDEWTTAWSDEWLDARVDACLATHVRHEHSEQILDRRMTCLDRRKAELAAVLDVIESAPAATVARVWELTGLVDDAATCADLTLLAADVPPADPATRDTVEQLRARMARAMATHMSGELAPALIDIDQTLESAIELGYMPLVAEARLTRSAILDSLGRGDESLAAAIDAVWEAHAAGADRIAAIGAIHIVSSLAETRKFTEIDGWIRHARAAVARHPASIELSTRLVAAQADEARVRDRFDDARAGYTEAHRMCEQYDEELNCLTYLFHLASVEHAAGNLDAALALGEDVLAVELVKLGGDHPRVASSLNNLGILLRTMGRLGEARARLDEAARILSAVDPNHPTLTYVLNNRATVALFENDYAGAERDYRATYAALSRDSPDNPTLVGIRGNIALAIFAQGRFDEALEMQREVLATTIAVYGEQSMDVADALANIGDVLTELDRFDEAADHYQRALSIRETLGGKDHIDVARAQCNLGGVEQLRGRAAEALAYYEACKKGFERTYGAEDAQVAIPEAGIGEALVALQRSEAGLASLRRALELSSGSDTQPAQRAQLESTLGRLQWELGIEQDAARAMVTAAQRVLAQTGGLFTDDAKDAAEWLRDHGRP